MAVVKMYVLLFVALVFAGVAMPIAHAQLGLVGIGGLLNSLPISVTGIVPCSMGGSVTSNVNGFANATVQLKCGGTTLGTTTTNSNGAFSIIGALPLLSGLLNNCNVVVTTPLASCNVNLPTTRILTAPLNLISYILGILNFITGTFTLVPGT